MDAIIQLLISEGYLPDGHTDVSTFRAITNQSFPFAGGTVVIGGRLRFYKPGTEKKVTVGKRTTCCYRSKNGEAFNFRNFRTTDIKAIEKAI